MNDVAGRIELARKSLREWKTNVKVLPRPQWVNIARAHGLTGEESEKLVNEEIYSK